MAWLTFAVKANGKQQGFEPNISQNPMQRANKAKKASKNVYRTLVTLHLYPTVNVWGSCCRGLCLFVQLVSHTCACTEGLGSSQRAGVQAQSILSLWEEEINTKVSFPSHQYLTLCVSQLTLWEGGRWVCCVVYPHTSMIVEFIK